MMTQSNAVQNEIKKLLNFIVEIGLCPSCTSCLYFSNAKVVQ